MLTPEQIKSNLEEFYALIEKHISEPRTTLLLGLYQGQEENLAFAPASSKTHFHNAFPGGYVDHVIRVVKAALALTETWKSLGATINFTEEELVFAALNHDLGKLGVDKKPSYIPNDSEWHIKNQGAAYKPNPELPFTLIQDRSLFILQSHGITVTFNEYLAIKIHDGLYDESNRAYLLSGQNESRLRCSLPLILHQADLLASRVEWETVWLDKLTGNTPAEKTLSTKPSTPAQFKAKADAKKLSDLGKGNPSLLAALKNI